MPKQCNLLSKPGKCGSMLKEYSMQCPTPELVSMCHCYRVLLQHCHLKDEGKGVQLCTVHCDFARKGYFAIKFNALVLLQYQYDS